MPVDTRVKVKGLLIIAMLVVARAQQIQQMRPLNVRSKLKPDSSDVVRDQGLYDKAKNVVEQTDSLMIDPYFNKQSQRVAEQVEAIMTKHMKEQPRLLGRETQARTVQPRRLREEKRDHGDESSSLDKADIRVKQTATPLHLTINLVTSGLGAGIFSLPWSTAGASVVPSLAIIAGTLFINAWTLDVLVRAAEKHQIFDLGSLLALLPGNVGKVAQGSCNAAIWFKVYLILVAYIVIICDAFMPLFEGTVLAHRPVVALLGSAAVLPLCFLNQRYLSLSSLVAVAVNSMIFVQLCTLVRSGTGVCYLGVGKGSIAMGSAMMQSVIIQMCVLSMYVELKDRSPQKFMKILRISFGILFFLYGGFSVVGYLAFGSDVDPNVLLSLPKTPWGDISRLCAAASVMAVYPIMLNSMVAPLRLSETIRQKLWKKGVHPTVAVDATTVVIVLAASALSLFVRDLGFLTVVNGAMSVGIFVALAPGLIGLWLLREPGDHFFRAKLYVLIFTGMVFMVLGLLYTDNYAASLKCFR